MSGKFLSEARFSEVRSAVAAGAQPWADAHRHLVAQADGHLEQPPVSVRDNGGSPFFRQDGAYVPGRDGVRNAEANHESGNLAGKFSSAALDLALAYRLTGEPRYADGALAWIHSWCINQNTRMFATGFIQDAATPGGQYGGDILLFARLRNAFLAMYLLDDYTGWDLRSQAAVRQWVRDMVEPQRKLMFYQGRPMYNNWEDARLLYLCTGSLFLGNLDLLLYTFDRWQAIIPVKMTDEGELPRETMRTRSMHYTLFALNSATLLAEIARAYGVDLYDCSINGRGIKLAIDYAAQFLLDMESWPFEMIEPIDSELSQGPPALFEMAHSRWGEAHYLQVIDRYGGRPVTKDHATLLYARDPSTQA